VTVRFWRKGASGAGVSEARPRERSYTLMIIPSARSRVRKLVVRERFLKAAVAVAGVGALLLALLLIDYARGLGRLSELKQLRAEAAAQRVKAAQVAQGLVELENGMSRLRKFEARLRTAFDLDRDYYNQETLLGIGGGETSLADMVSGLDVRQSDLAAQVDRDLERMKGRVEAQEQGFSELVSFLEDRKSLLASTPSIMPVRGWVTSAFRRRNDPFTGNAVWHRGLDISTGVGTPVIAPADGVVTYTGRKVDFGNIISLDHGYGYLTRYGHNSRIVVRAGQQVRRGQVIAFVGNTGKSTGPHLHYEVIRNGVPVNPQDYIIN
jgi:murein DD-endopeptidase MepM/ murein hydrolase activator NlpD